MRDSRIARDVAPDDDSFADTAQRAPIAEEAPPHPIARAVELARLTRATFGIVDAANLGWLMERWNVRAGTGLSSQSIDLVVQLVLHGDRDPRPLTAREVDDFVSDLISRHDLPTCRREAQRYATLRGTTAEQALRLDRVVRDRWEAARVAGDAHLGAPEVTRAA